MPHQCTDCGRTFDDGSKEMLSGCPNCGGNKFQFRPDDATRRESVGTTGDSSTTADSGGTAATPEGGPPPAGDGSAPTAGDGAAPSAGVGTIDGDILVADETPVDASDQAESQAAGEPAADPPEPTVDGTVARTVGKAATTVRDLVGSDDPPRGAPADVGAPSAPAPTDQPSDQPADKSVGAGVGDQAGARSSDSGENTAQASARGEVVSPGDLPETPENPDTSGTIESPTLDDDQAADEEYEDPADRPDLADLRAELNEQFESIKVLEPGQYELNLMELYDREEYIIALQEDGKYTIQVPEGYGDG